jgi:putative hydrolase of the HAD superfamily
VLAGNKGATDKSSGVMDEKITTLFLDIGGVLLSNGWDRAARQRAIEYFNLDGEEMNERHHLTFDTFESGKLTLDEYLNRIVFYEKRKFSKSKFKTFMFEQSKPLENSIEFFKELKQQYHLKVIAVSNEGRELNEFRINKYKLDDLFDSFVSSCFVHFRKPDTDIYNIACDISHTTPDQAFCIDDRLMFIQVARSIGIRGLHYQGLDAARQDLKTILF